MKRAFLFSCVLCLLGSLTFCGGGSSRPSGVVTSGIKKRALVSDSFNSEVLIIDAAADTFQGHIVTVGSGAGLMALSPDKKSTLIFDAGINTVVLFDNTTETVSGSIIIPDKTESMMVAPSNTTAYVAVRNAPVSGQASGAVEVLDLSAKTISTSVSVPAVTRLVLSHNGNKLLAFSDGSDSLAVIDTSSKAATTVPGFDRPTFGVFSSDDSKAYILNCGPECGGTAARVTILDMASNTPGANLAVSAATVGLLDSSGNLFVAGTSAAGGRLDVINTGSFTVSKSGVPITDGFHNLMTLASNNQLLIGAHTCSNTVNGCLSIFSTSSQNAVLSTPAGDITGIEPITGRNIVYVIQNGELVIYDTTTAVPQKTQIDVVGKAVDVKLIDQ